MILNALRRFRGLTLVLTAVGMMAVLAACAPDPVPTDQDNDGVPDTADQCPDTPAGEEVDATGCPVTEPPADDDNDGVPNEDDDCPGTAPGTEVDETGCPVTQPGTPDEDDDGVADDDDDCHETPAGEEVDENGCSASQLDADGDGVFDADDTCPDTPTGEEVDDNGCGPSQQDEDDDGVLDPDDDCHETPGGEDVDENGCSASQRDTDGDDVSDADDRCANTPEGEDVDAFGCSLEQQDDDTDGDGVADPDDTCADTPTGEEVDENGCADSQRDSDGDGVTDDIDECPDTPVGEHVDETGCVTPIHNGNGGNGGNGSTEPECGNGQLETGEQCEPPNTDTCDENCQSIGGGTNDSCSSPAAVADGSTISFNNEDATTDGPDEPTTCDFFDYTHVEADLWYCYTSTCTGLLTVSLCGSSYDTKVAVYNGCECPTEAAAISCSDDNCGVGSDSRLQLVAVTGNEYLIRVGGYEGAQGDGLLTIICGTPPSCTDGEGDCLADNGTPACDDEECCDAVCAVDQYCCDVTWDDWCASEADGLCGGTFDACEDGTGDCFTAHATAGCDDVTCCQNVCLFDPYCCLLEWDATCASEADERCGDFAVCGTSTDSCLAAHRDPGCSDEDCCQEVCSQIPDCCLVEWTSDCVDAANAAPDVCR